MYTHHTAFIVIGSARLTSLHQLNCAIHIIFHSLQAEREWHAQAREGRTSTRLTRLRRPTLTISRHLPKQLTFLARADYQYCRAVVQRTLPPLNQRLTDVTQSSFSPILAGLQKLSHAPMICILEVWTTRNSTNEYHCTQMNIFITCAPLRMLGSPPTGEDSRNLVPCTHLLYHPCTNTRVINTSR